MANLLFVIHGMGVHNDPETDDDAQHHWCDTVRDKIDEVASHYQGFGRNGNRFSEQVEVVPITYDKPFRELLAKWNKQAAEVQSTIIEERVRHAPNIVGWLAQVDGQVQQEFFWSHVVDVLLYEFFDNIAKQIRLLVIDQILDAISEARAADPVVRIQFLAHSLGTAVLHDSLSLLSTQSRAPDLEGPGFRFSSVFMLANVGRVLEDNVDELRVYKSVVCPPQRDGRPNYFNYYWNIRHSLDPIPAFRPFGPVNWAPEYYSDICIDHISNVNIHGYTHYLDHPDVHIPLIKMAAGRSSLTPKDAPYKPTALPCSQAVQDLRRESRALIALLQGQTAPFDLVKAAAQFFAIAEEAKKKCTGELVAEEGL